MQPSKKVVESSEDESSEEELVNSTYYRIRKQCIHKWLQKSKPVKKEAKKGEKRKQDDTVERDSNGNQFFEVKIY